MARYSGGHPITPYGALAVTGLGPPVVSEITASRVSGHVGAGTTVVATNPGVTTGNFLLATVAAVGGDGVLTAPTDWTLLASNTGLAAREIRVWGRVASNEEASWTFGAPNGFADVTVREFRNVDTNLAAIAATATTATDASAGTTITLPAISAVDHAVCFYACVENNTSEILAPSASMIALGFEVYNFGRDHEFVAFDMPAGSVGGFAVSHPAPTSTAASVGLVIGALPDRQAYRDLIISDGPCGYWRLGEGSGNLFDSAGGNVGTPATGVTQAMPGIVAQNGAISLDGSSTSKAITATTPNLSSAPPFSIETWSFCTGAGFTGEPWDCIVGENGSVRMLVNNGTGNVFVAANNTALVSGADVAPLNQWNHIVYVADATTEYIYVNTVLVATRAKLSTPRFNVGPLVFGSYEIGTTTHYAFNGSIDEVAIYPYALSPAQIAAHYTAGT